MNFKLILFCVGTILQCLYFKETSQSFLYHPCLDNGNIFYYVEPSLPFEESSLIILVINETLQTGTTVNITVKESTSSVTEAANKSSYLCHTRPYDFEIFSNTHKVEEYDTYTGQVTETVTMLTLPMEVDTDAFPVIDRIQINGVAIKCNTSGSGNIQPAHDLDSKEQSNKIYEKIAEIVDSMQESQNCGIRGYGMKNIDSDWPWHVALKKFREDENMFICGGTLISKFLVLTAADCVIENGMPIATESLNVIVGALSLSDGEKSGQEKKIQKISIHPDYDYNSSLNNIAILKLKEKLTITNKVMPVCLWNPKLAKKLTSGIVGTVTGWGLYEENEIKNKLEYETLEKVAIEDCKQNNNLLNEKLNENIFCAGYNNGKSTCTGDSGGGYHVFVPDTPSNTTSQALGKWYLYGIASTAVSRDGRYCDANNYGLYTSVANYINWIKKCP